MKEKVGPWTKLSSKTVYDNPWIKVSHEEVLNPNGGEGIYGKIHFKNRAIGIIPIDAEGYTWLVGQHRYPLNTYTWEIPEGGGPFESTPLEAAQRELLEETGLVADEWNLIQEMQLSNSVSDEVGFIYTAEGLTQKAPCPEETEQLTLKRIPIEEAINMVLNGEITDSLSVAGLLKLHVMRSKN